MRLIVGNKNINTITFIVKCLLYTRDPPDILSTISIEHYILHRLFIRVQFSS